MNMRKIPLPFMVKGFFIFQLNKPRNDEHNIGHIKNKIFLIKGMPTLLSKINKDI